MRVIRADAPTRLRRRICVACGYDGPEIEGDLGHVSFRCPECGQDIYARPPMTYLEMEGFVPMARADPPEARCREPDRRGSTIPRRGPAALLESGSTAWSDHAPPMTRTSTGGWSLGVDHPNRAAVGRSLRLNLA